MYQTEQLDRNEQIALDQITENMRDVDAAMSLNLLSTLLRKIWRKKVLIFLDEYDTPLQEAYVNGYLDELTAFIRTLFNNAFKTNPSLERGVMAGITRVSKESIFSDLNNLVVVTTTSEQYATAFGFTEQEVFTALERQGFTENDKQNVKSWYDGFTFGRVTDIYKTSFCPLARIMRKELRKRGIERLKVVYSQEEALTPEGVTEELPQGRRSIPGSVSFVPSAAGLILAGEVIKDIVNRD